MTALLEDFTLENGVQLPKIGFGTWQIPDGSPAYDSVSSALLTGYRHIDTARVYGNEASVGRAVRDSGIPREQIFVASKVPAEIKDHDEALASFETTMETLGFDYVDLYMIHAPWPWSNIGQDCSAGNKAVWKALERIHDSGRARSIGVSNFNVADVNVILEDCSIKPMVNQIRFFIGNAQAETLEFCRRQGIQVTGYSPLATGKILNDENIRAMADRYGRSVAQICIRYVLQKDVGPLPKSTHPARIKENADVDFEITADDMRLLDGFSRQRSATKHPRAPAPRCGPRQLL